MPTQAEDAKLVSIERVVAFVLGPAVIAGSAALSGWLSTKLGVKVTPATISTAVGTGGLTAGALVWKWLHGRQKWVEQRVEAGLEAIKQTPGGGALIQVTEQQLEEFGRHTAQLAVAAIARNMGGSGDSPPAASVQAAAAQSAERGAASES